jgi:putative acetyltransferase
MIRGQRSDDWESLYALLSQNAVIRNSLELPYPAEDTIRDRFGSPPPHTHVLVAEAGLPSGRRQIVGVAWLRVLTRRRRHIGVLSLVMHPDYSESDEEDRLMTAVLDLADNWLGLRRLEVTVYAEAAPEIALYERHGFEVEVTLRRYALRDGVYSDAHMLARLRALIAGDKHDG